MKLHQIQLYDKFKFTANYSYLIRSTIHEQIRVWWTISRFYWQGWMISRHNIPCHLAQGSTLTVVRLGIPSSFCCRTTWTYVYGCPIVKLIKLTKWIILDRPFISDWVNLTCSALIRFYFFHYALKIIKSDLRATLDPSMADLLHIASLEGWLINCWVMVLCINRTVEL